MLKKSTHKYKFDRRRALECTFVEKSKNNPGYLKYLVTIGEKDGTKHTQPVYGKDMQDALSRLINQERTVKVERKLESNTGLIFLIWLILRGVPSFFVEHHTPWFLVYTMGTLLVLILAATWWYNYIRNGE